MDQREYVCRLLDAYRVAPGTCGVARRADRVQAAHLHERGVPIEALRMRSSWPRLGDSYGPLAPRLWERSVHWHTSFR